MKSEFKRTLTNEELDRLERLGKDIEGHQKLYSDASIERLNLETEKQTLEQEIRTILYPRRDQLKSRSVDDDDSQLEERRKELESLKKALADILARQKATENEVEKIAKSLRENQAKLTELQVQKLLDSQLTIDFARGDCSSDRTESEKCRAKYDETDKPSSSTRRM